MDHNLPIVPGLYWASDVSTSGYWDFIVELSGEAPFFKCEFLYYCEHEPIPNIRKLPEKLYYGPKIEIPKRDSRAIQL